MSNLIPRVLLGIIVFICSLGKQVNAKEGQTGKLPVLQTKENVLCRIEGNRSDSIAMYWKEGTKFKDKQEDKEEDAEMALARQREYVRQSMREYRICMSGLLVLMMVVFLILLIKNPCPKKKKKKEKK